MSKARNLKALEARSDDGAEHSELPYRIELGEDGAEPTVLALCGSPNVAYAAYYAGIREYFGQPMKLCRGDRVLASSERRPRG